MLLTFASCGGGGETTLSNEEFASQLKSVCSKGAKTRETFVNNLSREYYEKREQRATPEYQAENLLNLMAIVQDTTAEIAAIGLPESKAKKVEDLIRMREEAAAKVEASPLGTRDNLQAIFESSSEASRALGVGSCDL